jgi:hypothetical protein
MSWPVPFHVLFEAVSACLGGGLLWLAWKYGTDGLEIEERGVAAIGFLLRALAGVTLFWISFVGLDIGRSLQIGDGLWLFALDATEYLKRGRDAAAAGLLASAALPKGGPSVFFVQVLSVLMVFIGSGAGAGLLLNCGSFLVGNVALARWCRAVGRNGRPALTFALVTVSLSPSWILWATQPLKDAFFVGLVLVWFFASACWLRNVLEPESAARETLTWSLGLTALISAIAGIRPYVALMFWAALGAGLFLGSVRCSGRRRLRTVAGPWLLWILLAGVVLPAAPAAFVDVQDARRRFIEVGGATAIYPPSAAGVALFLPRFVGQALGLFSIGGGRGFWAFAEVDTLFFLAATIVSGVLATRAVRRARRLPPVALQVLVSALLVTIGLSSVVTNFGTLFRLRETILVCLACLPLAAMDRAEGAREGGDPTSMIMGGAPCVE